MTKTTLSIALLLSTISVNTVNAEPTSSFSEAKTLMLNQVYFDHQRTLYCNAKFDHKKRITLPQGFTTATHKKRAKRVEWEHVVPAENFGRTFTEWREGHPSCVDNKGKSFKGRNCASKVNLEYRFMQSDLYNLVPAIGAVNAKRSNYNFTMLPHATPSTFGSCTMKIEGRKVEPPVHARGEIARTYLYMEDQYKRFKMSKQQRKLMLAWNKIHPVTKWECTRAWRIGKIQGNQNKFVMSQCKNK